MFPMKVNPMTKQVVISNPIEDLRNHPEVLQCVEQIEDTNVKDFTWEVFPGEVKEDGKMVVTINIRFTF